METKPGNTEPDARILAKITEVSLLSRIHNLTDAVFAIAMTLLMLNFRIPTDLPRERLPEILSMLAPEAFTYFLSFAALGALWIADYNHYRFIRSADRPFLWITIFFLSFVALIPASTAVLGRYYDNQLVVIAYSVHLTVCALALYWQWHYATKNRRLIDADTDNATITRMKNRIRVPVALNLIGVALAFVSPFLTLAVFAIVLILAMIPYTSDRIADSFDGIIFKKP